MLVSVVIATYKRTALLKRCLYALLGQTFPHADYEIIIISDGPDRETEKAVIEIALQCNVLILVSALPKKKGPAAARNKGWQLAKGALVLFTDDDCIPHPQWIQQFWLLHEAYPEVVFSGRTIVPISAIPTDYEKNISHLETASFITANCACPKQLLQIVGGFDERFEMAWREDSDLEFNLRSHKVTILPAKQAIVCHPVRKAKWGVSLQEQKKTMYNALLYKKYPDMFRRHVQQHPNWRYYLMISTLIAGIISLLAGFPFFSCLLFLLWIIQVLLFTINRLYATTKRTAHLAEMLVTSALIPFLSVYWTLYGARKFHVFYF